MSLESVFKLSLIMNMIDNLSGPMANISSRVGESVSRLDALSARFGGMAKTGAAMTAMGSQIADAALAPVAATFETQRALGELSSLGVQDLDALETAARSFSDQWSGTSKADFISAAYDIKSGISSLSDEGVAEFTSLAALTAKATKATAGEMTSLFATGYGIYKGYYSDLSDIEFGEMFSAGISESVRAFKTSGSGMAQGIQTLGASATTANVPLEEQLAILGMLQATMSGSEAGTKYKAFLRSAAKGGEALGLSFLDANNQLLSMPEILEKLRGKFGETMDAAEKMQLQTAFGDTEAVALIDLMYSKTGALQDNILNLYDAMGQGTGVAEKMAGAMQETEPERFERLQQRIHNVAESIGGSMLPAINDFLSLGEQVLSKVGAWIEENQELVRVIMMIVLGIGGFLTIGGAALTVIGGIGLAFTRAAALGKNFISAIKGIPKTLSTIRTFAVGAGGAVRTAFSAIRSGGSVAVSAIRSIAGPFASAVGGMISSLGSLAGALLANPITWVVIGIVAVISALVLLWNKCEWFRDGVTALIGTVKEKISAAIDFIKGIFGAIGSWFGSALESAKAVVSEKLNNIRTTFESNGGGIRGAAAVAIESIKNIFSTGFSFLDNLTGGRLSAIRDKFSEKLAPISGMVGAVMDAAKTTVSQQLDSIRTAFESNGGGLRGTAAAALESVKAVFTSGFIFLDNLTDGKLAAIRDRFSEKLTAAGNAVSSALESVQAVVSEKLNHIQMVYQSHGGGLQGVAAAAIEGVKNIYSMGFSALDAATGGRLSEIRNKFSSAMSGIVQGVRQGFTNVRTAFSVGLNNIRNMISGAVNWFFQSGQRVVTTFANGIRSAFGTAVSAVKGGLQNIRNMLPFSDAKEGPLSTLTLSGQRTMTTYAHGLTLAQNAPAEAIEQGLTRTRAALTREEPKKISIRNSDSVQFDEDSNNGESSGKNVIIQKLLLQVDLKKIKDLQLLLNLLKDVEDYASSNGEMGPDDDPDAAFALA